MVNIVHLQNLYPIKFYVSHYMVIIFPCVCEVYMYIFQYVKNLFLSYMLHTYDIHGITFYPTL